MADAGAYRGEAVRVAASVRGEEAGSVALSVQLMDRRAEDLRHRVQSTVLEGTLGWRQLEVTPGVPVEAGAIAFGVRLRRRGAVHVGRRPVRGGGCGDLRPPRNLDLRGDA